MPFFPLYLLIFRLFIAAHTISVIVINNNQDNNKQNTVASPFQYYMLTSAEKLSQYQNTTPNPHFYFVEPFIRSPKLDSLRWTVNIRVTYEYAMKLHESCIRSRALAALPNEKSYMQKN